uniref:Histone H2A n=1 Tax=Strombidium inclinatum TaxID=197538 RepID=A0A7S3MTC5_9SPIT|mmetsp:Transcript_11066/g.16820  ORF Transcript_11066/g.16820 Transcript_11066/m.16820 type:complete len:154 (+) Transcript_11066:16-477(+)
MPTKGNEKKEKGNRKSKKQSKAERSAPISNTLRAGTCFPVGRLNRMLKQGRFAERISGSAGVYMAGVLDYIAAELLDVGGEISLEQGYKILLPRHLNMGIRGDRALDKMMSTCTLIESPVRYHVETALLPKEKKKNLPEEEETNIIGDLSQPL